MERESYQRLNQYSSVATEADIERIDGRLESMNRGRIAKVWGDVQNLWSLIKDPSAAWKSKAVAIGALLYLITPLDAVPDLVPLFGLSDDVGVIVAAVAMLCAELAKYQKQKSE